MLIAFFRSIGGLSVFTLLFLFPHLARSSSEQVPIALNAYIDFANESIHLLSIIHERVEAYNQAANQWIAQPTDQPPVFSISDQLSGHTYIGELQGICLRTPGLADPGINLKNLWEESRVRERMIPPPARMKLHQYRAQLWASLGEVLAICEQLDQYSHSSQSGMEPHLATAYLLMKQVGIQLEKFQAIKQEMYFLIQGTSPPVPKALTDLANLMDQVQSVMLSARAENAQDLATQLDRLERTLSETKANQARQVQALDRIGLYYDRGNTVYEHVLDYGRQIVRIGRASLGKESINAWYAANGRVYYFYNKRLLSLYNHHKYGLTAYYNRFLSFSQTPLLKTIEQVPTFRLIPPPMPASQVQDLVADDPVLSLLPPGAPVNHLIFLIDVSASMKKPEKLPLLKSALASLLASLRPEDQISLVVYSGKAQVIIQEVSAREKDKIFQRLDRVNGTGETNFNKGLKLAYELAESSYLPEGNNRIILATDGDFDYRNAQLKLIGNKSEIPIYFSVLLFSKFETLLARTQLQLLSQAGAGNYYHVEEDNALQILHEEAAAFSD
jgi:hypothetical protein